MSFESLTDEKILELIQIPKVVVSDDVKEKRKGKHLQKNFEIVAKSDENIRFEIFTRQNLEIVEDFSCGLKWLAPGGEDMILVRYNGSSHPHPNKIEKNRLDFVNHIHRTTERYLQMGRPDGFAELSDKYSNMTGALKCLSQECNVEGIGDLQEELFHAK